MNKVTLIGRTTKTIELRETGKGKNARHYAYVTLAIRAGVNEDGEELTDFVPCTLWGRTAEIAADYVQKGDLVALSGKVRQSSYDKDGETVYKTDISINEIELIAGNRKRQDEDEDEDDTPKKKASRKSR